MSGSVMFRGRGEVVECKDLERKKKEFIYQQTHDNQDTDLKYTGQSQGNWN